MCLGGGGGGGGGGAGTAAATSGARHGDGNINQNTVLSITTTPTRPNRTPSQDTIINNVTQTTPLVSRSKNTVRSRLPLACLLYLVSIDWRHVCHTVSSKAVSGRLFQT